MAVNCDIAVLANETPVIGALDKVDFQALKVWLLAQILLAMGGEDYTDLCALAKDMQQYDSLPDYKRRSIQIQILINSLLDLDVGEITEAQAREAIRCAHCCDATTQSLDTAEWFLICLIGNAQNRQQVCWVAREVYGWNNLRWLLFAFWLMDDAPRWLRALYIRHGERFAQWIADKPRIKNVIRFFMDRAIKR